MNVVIIYTEDELLFQQVCESEEEAKEWLSKNHYDEAFIVVGFLEKVEKQ